MKALAILLAFACTLGTFAAKPGRHEELAARIATGPHLGLAAATYFGGAGDEEFVEALPLPGGTLFAIGNTRETGTPPARARGFVARYEADLSKILDRWHTEPGEAVFTAAALSTDSRTLYLAGTPGPDFARLQRRMPRSTGAGRHAFLLALNLPSYSPAWLTALPLSDAPQRVFLHLDGRIGVASQVKGDAAFALLAPDGRRLGASSLHVSDRGGFFAFDPARDGLWFGSDRNTHTGREPWRQPFLHLLALDRDDPAKGARLVRLWEWKPALVRGDGAYRLESDSSITDLATAPDGDLVIAAWSDGGNSTLTRQPRGLDEKWPPSALGVSTWGMRGATGLSWLLRLDPHSLEVKTGVQWTAFIPQGFEGGPGNWPNTLTIERLAVLRGGEIAITGFAHTGLVSTPNAFWQTPAGYAGKYHARYVTVFNATLDHVLFSSYLPGHETVRLMPAAAGLLIAGRVRRDDALPARPASPPSTASSAQPSFGGGKTDAHLIVLR